LGEVVNFDGSGSYDPDGTVVDYDWAFGDTSTATGVSPTHSYDTAGTYTVTLTVTDDEDATDSDTATISVITPEHATQDLITMIEEMGLPDGVENSFVSKLENAINSLMNDRPSAAGQLGAFINEVNAQRGVTLTDAEADALIAFAQWIIDNL
jgi:PKD repeat protein